MQNINNVYIILDDYLPVSLVPVSAGFTTKPTETPYSVWHSNRDGLLSSLTTSSYWSEFANGVEGALATGGSTNPQFIASWNGNPEMNARQLKTETVYLSGTNGGALSDVTKLYIPHTEAVANSCNGYWMATPSATNSSNAWCINYSGDVGSTKCTGDYRGVRPVVCLPSNLEGTVGETI